MTLTTLAHDRTGEPATLQVPAEYAADMDLFLAYQRLMGSFAEVLRSDKCAPLTLWDLYHVLDRIFVSKFSRLRAAGVFSSIFDAHTQWTAIGES